MVAYRMVLMAGAVAALPLNINLGAYSPALVVGDGEISFGGNSDVSTLMNTLQGAAATAANGAATNAAQAQAAAAAPAATTAATTATTGATEAAAPASAVVSEPAAVPVSSPAAAQQIASLQGMGKAILPRDATTDSTQDRDLASFDRALTFAEAALVKGPKVQLGTGREGSGVGIIVDNNQQAAARPGTGTTAKRDLSSSPSSGPKVKVTTMYVRSGIPSCEMTARDLSTVEPRYETIQIAPNNIKRDAGSASGAIDAVNLNVNGDQGVTMTFVETVNEGDEENDE
ncbi:hypothetical protein BD289DRAFT_363573 [Coniella lustricola]|uniref:Uncharacterized protein n=1 Tax=Coniella lustricola TaxID=2025994 RepID=A0A2T3AEZ1_9PEZI|nr:hypothetical protein BD289DRAFT_363573 [Coniella lustricola]